MKVLPPNKMDTLSWILVFVTFNPLVHLLTKQQQRLVFLSLQRPLVDLDSTSRAFFFCLSWFFRRLSKGQNLGNFFFKNACFIDFQNYWEPEKEMKWIINTNFTTFLSHLLIYFVNATKWVQRIFSKLLHAIKVS